MRKIDWSNLPSERYSLRIRLELGRSTCKQCREKHTVCERDVEIAKTQANGTWDVHITHATSRGNVITLEGYVDISSATASYLCHRRIAGAIRTFLNDKTIRCDFTRQNDGQHEAWLAINSEPVEWSSKIS